mmetsp:Transcript_24934/g.86847  ORF Transcript_24934/g.86847 Transcript_24934/m.86847 type:complete len:616 (+) Transcript_24934:1670-3517(+)
MLPRRRRAHPVQQLRGRDRGPRDDGGRVQGGVPDGGPHLLVRDVGGGHRPVRRVGQLSRAGRRRRERAALLRQPQQDPGARVRGERGAAGAQRHARAVPAVRDAVPEHVLGGARGGRRERGGDGRQGGDVPGRGPVRRHGHGDGRRVRVGAPPVRELPRRRRHGQDPRADEQPTRGVLHDADDRARGSGHRLRSGVERSVRRHDDHADDGAGGHGPAVRHPAHARRRRAGRGRLHQHRRHGHQHAGSRRHRRRRRPQRHLGGGRGPVRAAGQLRRRVGLRGGARRPVPRPPAGRRRLPLSPHVAVHVRPVHRRRVALQLGRRLPGRAGAGHVGVLRRRPRRDARHRQGRPPGAGAVRREGRGVERLQRVQRPRRRRPVLVRGDADVALLRRLLRARQLPAGGTAVHGQRGDVHRAVHRLRVGRVRGDAVLGHAGPHVRCLPRRLPVRLHGRRRGRLRGVPVRGWHRVLCRRRVLDVPDDVRRPRGAPGDGVRGHQQPQLRRLHDVQLAAVRGHRLSGRRRREGGAHLRGMPRRLRVWVQRARRHRLHRVPVRGGAVLRRRRRRVRRVHDDMRRRGGVARDGVHRDVRRGVRRLQSCVRVGRVRDRGLPGRRRRGR